MEGYEPKHPMGYYLSHQWIRALLRGENTRDVVKRIVYFMDKTGLRPSSARVLHRKCDNIIKTGFDHTILWYKDKKYIYSTEPYRNHQRLLESSLKRQGVIYTYTTKGIWNPPSTLMYLIQIPGQLKVEEVLNDLEAIS